MCTGLDQHTPGSPDQQGTPPPPYFFEGNEAKRSFRINKSMWEIGKNEPK